ncbi:MAG: Zn-dependent hydrolase [Calditrichaeota bacterium]|nr:Zn-dependent hydrolase [Calditrichota bacterium]
MDNIHELAKIGFNTSNKGIYRQGITETDREGRDWLINKMKAIGLKTHYDGALNVFGKYGKSKNPSVMIGSHLDTVPCGGMFDGALGVLAGLECIQTLVENNVNTKHPIELVATSEEEGRFGGMLGAEAIAGKITPDWIESASDSKGEYLMDAFRKLNLRPHDILKAYRSPETIHSFLELHIEQGPVLEKEGFPIGVVEGISGVFKWHIRLIGKANHAGTAPMDMRADAFMGLADFAHEIPRIIDEEGTDKSRLAVGRCELKPGFAHTIPGEAEFTLVGRDMEAQIMHNLANSCRKVLSAIARKHHLMFEYEEKSWLEPKPCHNDVIKCFEKHAQKLNYNYKVMPSGAGHDTQFMTDITRAGMIFVPSVGGVSHSPEELSHWADIEKGCNLLFETMLDFAEAV